MFPLRYSFTYSSPTMDSLVPWSSQSNRVQFRLFYFTVLLIKVCSHHGCLDFLEAGGWVCPPSSLGVGVGWRFAADTMVGLLRGMALALVQHRGALLAPWSGGPRLVLDQPGLLPRLVPWRFRLVNFFAWRHRAPSFPTFSVES